MRVCHRDLKLENFVLDKSQSTLKLIDFGLSVVWAEGQTLFKSYGTPCYTAPEIIGGKRYLGPQADVRARVRGRGRVRVRIRVRVRVRAS